MRKTSPKQREAVLERYPGGVSKGPASHPRYPFLVRWPGEGGKRLVRWFSNDTEALAWAKAKSAEAGELGSAFGSVSEDERAAVAAFRTLAGKYDNPKPPTLLEVVKEFTKRWEASRAGATVAASVPAFLEAKKAEGRSQGHLATLKARLGRVMKDFGERVLPSFTTAEISDYLLGLRGLVLKHEAGPPKGRRRKDGTLVRKDRPPARRDDGLLSLETRAGYRASLHSFFEWAVGRDLVPSNPVTYAANPTPKPKLPGILHPAEAHAFFAALTDHAAAIVPFWAVRAFAGLRESEAVAATWQMVDLKAGAITLPATITKTRKPRIVAILPTLAEFLKLCSKKSGPLCGLSPMARRWHLRLAMRHLPKLRLPRNWARHSFATYHLEEFRKPGETSLQLGHRGGPELLHLRYAGAATEAEAHEFWAIRPATPVDNVVPMTSEPTEAVVPKPKTPKRKGA